MAHKDLDRQESPKQRSRRSLKANTRAPIVEVQSSQAPEPALPVQTGEVHESFLSSIFYARSFKAYRFSTPPSRAAATRKYEHESDLERKINQLVASFAKTHGYRPDIVLAGPLTYRGETLIRDGEVWLSLRPPDKEGQLQQSTGYDPRLLSSERKK